MGFPNCKNTTFHITCSLKNALREWGFKPEKPPKAVLFLLFIVFQLVTADLYAQTSDSLFQGDDHFHILLEADGYIPVHDSYRINYETKTLGIPMEIGGGLLFPASERLSGGAMFHYKRREASFVNDMSISTFELEPRIHYYLDKPEPGEIKILGIVGLLLARTTASGSIESTQDGSVTTPKSVSKDYYNYGFTLGLGLEYPVASISAIYANLRLGTYFGDAIKSGGLGNVGGITIGIGYKLGI